MLPALGFMVGCYIVVRMLSLLTQPVERREAPVVRVAAVLTILFTAVVLFVLWGTPTPPALR